MHSHTTHRKYVAFLFIAVIAAVLLASIIRDVHHTAYATSTSSGQANWNMYGFDPQHTHYNPYENILNTQNVSNLTQVWQASLSTNTFTSPVVANGITYVFGGSRKLYAFNATTGTRLWIVTLGSSNGFYSYASPAVSNGIVYVGTLNAKLYALDATTGQTVWIQTLKGIISNSPVVVNGILYTSSSSNKDQGELYAFNAFSGQQIWSIPFGSSLSTSSPAVANGLVYIGTYDGTVEAFNAKTGERLWFNNVGSDSFASPTVADGYVFIVGGPGIVALNAKTGKERWSYSIFNVTATTPSVANGIVYIGSYTLNALNAKTGKLLWATQSGDSLGETTIANGVAYAGTSGSYGNYLYAFDATAGTILWTYSLPSTLDAISAAPVVVNGSVYALEKNGALLAFHLPG